MGETRAESRAEVVARLDGAVQGELERDLVVNKVRLVCERAALPFIVASVRCPLVRLFRRGLSPSLRLCAKGKTQRSFALWMYDRQFFVVSSTAGFAHLRGSSIFGVTSFFSLQFGMRAAGLTLSRLARSKGAVCIRPGRSSRSWRGCLSMVSSGF